jgi:hypothetical protein
VLLGGLGVAAVGSLAYVLTRRARSAPGSDAAPEAAPDTPRVAELRESQVVPRGSVPDPLEVDLGLDGVFRFDADVGEEATVQCDTKVPPFASADDAEPPGADDLGNFWLSRATQAEHSFSEAELQVDLENVADISDEGANDDGDDDDDLESESEYDAEANAPSAVGARRF